MACLIRLTAHLVTTRRETAEQGEDGGAAKESGKEDDKAGVPPLRFVGTPDTGGGSLTTLAWTPRGLGPPPDEFQRPGRALECTRGPCVRHPPVVCPPPPSPPHASSSMATPFDRRSGSAKEPRQQRLARQAAARVEAARRVHQKLPRARARSPTSQPLCVYGGFS